VPDAINRILPSSLKRMILLLPQHVSDRLEEIRIRENRPFEVIFNGTYKFISSMGKLLDTSEGAYLPTHEDCQQLLGLLTNHSVYSFEEELMQGFITIEGGHRVGLTGRTVLLQGRVKQIKEISGFNIRVARAMIGVGTPVLPHLVDMEAKAIFHTLVISPPQYGKTTLIRDLARLISYGIGPHSIFNQGGLKVGIIDERSELAACVKGIPSFDVGPRTDVMDRCPKAEGMMMMIRSMSPDVLVVDEIGRKEDVDSIHEAVHAGIQVMATAHGKNYEDIIFRPVLKQLIAEQIFGRYVVLGHSKGVGTIESIHDAKGRKVQSIVQSKVSFHG
jgi:stage III sporulation protein AA